LACQVQKRTLKGKVATHGVSEIGEIKIWQVSHLARDIVTLLTSSKKSAKGIIDSKIFNLFFI